MTQADPMRQRYAVLFPGQGSQALGMMANFKADKTVALTFEEASDALGVSLWALIDDSRLNETQFTQPVILAASIALWRILTQRVPVLPSYLAGHSLGEYSALCASGVLDLDEAVRLVHERGRLMAQAVVGVETQMAAVLGLTDAEVIALCQGEDADPANFNSPGQVVIAGTKDGVVAVLKKVQALGKKGILLAVSVPSHCRLMQPASERLAQVLTNTLFHVPSIPVIQNLSANVSQNTAAIKEALIRQLSEPVQWAKTMDKLANHGIVWAAECGYGKVLANISKRQAQPLPVLATDSDANLAKLAEKFAL